MPEDGTRRTKVRVTTSDGKAETLWARDLGQDRFQLDNIPFLAFGLSLNDVVSAPAVDGIPTFDRVLEPSGHSTYRLALQDDVDPETFLELVSALNGLGCGLERFTPRMIGVDIPPSVDIHAAHEVISRGMAAGHWYFDEANVEHPLK